MDHSTGRWLHAWLGDMKWKSWESAENYITYWLRQLKFPPLSLGNPCKVLHNLLGEEKDWGSTFNYLQNFRKGGSGGRAQDFEHEWAQKGPLRLSPYKWGASMINVPLYCMDACHSATLGGGGILHDMTSANFSPVAYELSSTLYCSCHFNLFVNLLFFSHCIYCTLSYLHLLTPIYLHTHCNHCTVVLGGMVIYATVYLYMDVIIIKLTLQIWLKQKCFDCRMKNDGSEG